MFKDGLEILLPELHGNKVEVGIYWDVLLFIKSERFSRLLLITFNIASDGSDVLQGDLSGFAIFEVLG